ncbi:MAG: cob(I)yrinic acid a,c-diamide adenosyltransferase [Planctomycetota bacterium]|jgi:cob(I)alamin adenosyltransferase|nr:cob(I)yrinic acid a,c-diamide adenosyltransferase [Planctomycetota bacterium]
MTSAKRGRARVLVVTGEGKGKTTAAAGILLRALGPGQKARLVRFAKTAPSGEMAILSALPNLTVVSGDKGMTPPPDDPRFPAHAAAARELFGRASAAAGDFDLIVLDEILGVVARRMIAEGDVLAFLSALRPEQAVILTGRGATPGIIDRADTVSDIASVKHAYDAGIAAEPGIEY